MKPVGSKTFEGQECALYAGNPALFKKEFFELPPVYEVVERSR